MKNLLLLTILLFFNEWAMGQTPAAPTELKLSVAGMFQIELSWKDNSNNETGFEIIRSTNNKDFSLIASPAANTASFSNTNLNDRTQYYYRIRAINSTGKTGSAYSNTSDATTLSVPEAPSKLSLSVVSSTQINLSWADNSIDDRSNRVERSTNGTSFSEIANLGANVKSYQSTGLASNTKYYYRVRAIFDDIDRKNPTSPYSNAADATTQASIPTAPSGLNLSQNWGGNSDKITEVNASWKDNSADDTGFDIDWGTDNTFKEGTKSVAANTTSLKITGSWNGCGQKIFVRVRAKNSAGNSAYIENNLTTAIGVPLHPNPFTATTKSDTQIDLIWGTNGPADVTTESEYIIKYALKNDLSGGTEISVPMNTLSKSITGLTSNTTYYFGIKGKNCAGESNYNNSLTSAKTNMSPPPPAAPTIQSSISMNWTKNLDQITEVTVDWKDNSNNETSFDIEWGDNNTFGFGKTNVGANVTQFKITDRNWPGCGGKVFLRVRAKNDAGVSAFSETNGTTAISIPEAPNTLTATAKSGSQIDLAWKGANESYSRESEFIVQYADNDKFQSSKEAKSNMNTDGTSITGLNANTKYFFRVKSHNCSGDSPQFSNTAEATTMAPPVTKPTTPTKLTASATSSTEISLSWSDVSDNETGFDIERSTDNANFGNSQSVNANVTTFSATGLNPNTKYFFRVRAKNSAGNSEFSNNAEATTMMPPLTKPTTPTKLTASATSSTEISLAWSDVSDNETGFDIERSTDNANFGNSQSVNANVTTFSATGLNPNTKYFFRVRAKNSAGNSEFSNTAEATTMAPPVTKPTAPTKLTASATSSTEISLAWSDVSDNETGFDIERSTDNANFGNSQSVNANVMTFSATGLNPNTKYFFRVRAKNSAGNSEFSNNAEATTMAPPVTKPTTPTKLTASATSSTEISLAWSDVSDNETGFDIERSTDNANFGNSQSVNANVMTFSATGLNPNTKYFFRVRAKNSAGNSEFSNTAEATTMAPPITKPTTPTKLTASATSSTEISLSWSDVSDNETGFDIERSTDNANFGNSQSVNANVMTLSATGLNPNTKYFFRVRAKNSAGNSDFSNTAEATTMMPPVTKPTTPTKLTASATSSTEISLAWSDVSDNETGFDIERSTDNANFGNSQSVNANVMTFSATGLNPNTKYFFRVRAKNSAGNSEFSNNAEATTMMPPVTKIATPANLRLQTGNPVMNQISVDWDDKATDETGYEIWRSIEVNTSFVVLKGDLAANTKTFADKPVRSATKYFYRVRAIRNGEFSDFSNVLETIAPLVSSVLPNRQETMVFPNPATDEITVLLDENTGYTIEILNGMGQLIKETKGRAKTVMSIKDLANGEYLVRISDIKESKLFKIIKH